MAKPILFADQFSLKGIPFFKDAADYAADVMKSKKAALRVETDATFSGYLLNGRVYPSIHMSAATPSWMSKARGGAAPYDKPVLLNHDAEHAENSIGRVVSATYYPLWQGDKLQRDWMQPSTGYTKGSGYTRLGLNITDMDAIERFLDGRYSTFSTSFTSPNLICSVCGCDWMQAFPDICDHQPMKVYPAEDDSKESILCYLITGPMDWREISVVNQPAQPFAVADLVKLLANPQDSATNLVPAGAASHQDFDGKACEVTLFDAEGNAIRLTKKIGETDAIPKNGKLRPSTKVSIPAALPSSPGDSADATGTVNIDEDAMEDEAFVTAAKKWIVYYKGKTPEKGRILDSINEILSMLGCSSGDPEQKQTNASENPNMTLPVTPTPAAPTPAAPTAAPAAPATPDPVAQDKGNERVAALADQIAELRKTQQALQADRDTKEADLKAARDQVATLTQELHDARVGHLVALRAVTVRKDGETALDTSAALVAYEGTLKARSSASIKDALADEQKVFVAKLAHLKGLPTFITDNAQPGSPAVTRVAEDPDTKGKSKSKPAEIDY